jgi:cell division protein FtsA
MPQHPLGSLGPTGYSGMMTNQNTPEIVVGLDLGTTKVSAVVGEVDDDGVTVLGVGNVPCRGLRKGVVSNIEWTVRAIREAVSAAQNMAGVEINTVYVGVSGNHIRSQLSDGVAAVSGREVTQADLDRVLEGARAIPVDADRMILHALPREYIVDNQDGVRDPIGMSGVRLQVKANLLTAATSCVQNAIRCVERSNLEVADVVLCALASAEAVLSEDEREIGGGVIDMGGGTTDLLLYSGGGIAHASTIPAGGNNVTADVAAGLRTPMAEAERLARSHGCALARLISDDEDIEVPGVGGHGARKVSRRVLGEIIEPRIEEIFTEVRRRIEEAGLADQLSSGLVLTGGSVLMEGMVEVVEEILGLPVRIGAPVGVRGIAQLVQGPQWSCGVGLVHYGSHRLAEARVQAEQSGTVEAMLSMNEETRNLRRSFWTRVFGKNVAGWLRAAF